MEPMYYIGLDVQKRKIKIVASWTLTGTHKGEFLGISFAHSVPKNKGDEYYLCN